MIQGQKQSLHIKKSSNLSYQPLRQISHLSPYHERVIMEKKYLQEKQHLRSILIMGHLQKMQLNAINNRSIETIRKMKAAQEMTKRRFRSADSPQTKYSLTKLKIDNRKKLKNQTKSFIFDNDPQDKQKIQRVQKVYEKLIDDYVKQVSKQKLLQRGFQRTKIIEQACQTIKAQMSTNFPGLTNKDQPALKQLKIVNEKRKTLSHSSNHINLPSISYQSLSAHKSNRQSNRRHGSILVTNQNQMIRQLNMKNFDNILPKQKQASSCYRSLTEVECTDNLKQLKVEENYLSKQRIRNEKLFLRKMKLIGAKSIRTLQRSSRLQ